MKNIIATVPQFAVLPPGTMHTGNAEFDMLADDYPHIKEKLVEVDEDGKVLFRKSGYKKKARKEK